MHNNDVTHYYKLNDYDEQFRFNDDGFDSRMGLSGDHRTNDIDRTRNRDTACDVRPDHYNGTDAYEQDRIVCFAPLEARTCPNASYD